LVLKEQRWALVCEQNQKRAYGSRRRLPAKPREGGLFLKKTASYRKSLQMVSFFVFRTLHNALIRFGSTLSSAVAFFAVKSVT
jgi:hypothetical protein